MLIPEVNYSKIHKMSNFSPSVIQPAGYLPQLKGDNLAVLNTINWQGRSFECDPRQLGYRFATGNEAHFHVTELGTPDLLWETFPADKPHPAKGPAWLAGVYDVKEGKLDSEIDWSYIPGKKIPSELGGAVARIVSEFGYERGMENIAACSVEGDDIVVSHVSPESDRQLIVINPDAVKPEKWTRAHKDQAKLIADLDNIDLTGVQKTELSEDGTKITLTLNLYNASGQAVTREVDVSCLRLDRSKMYYHPDDKKYSVKIVMADPNEDHQNLGRTHVHTFVNESIQETEELIIRGYRNEHGTFLKFESKSDPKVNIEIKLSRKILPYLSIRGELREWLKANNLSTSSVYRKSWKAINEIFEIDNLEWNRTTAFRPRYVLQFYETRDSRIKDGLEGLSEDVKDDLRSGRKSIVVTKALSAARVCHLDNHNGGFKGKMEVVPLNFDPTHGHPEDYSNKVIRLDPRPFAVYGTRFMSPIDTAIAPQHLIDPYIMGTEIMASVWPKVDQLGFFGVMMLAAMAFPHGSVFSDPSRNPWFLRAFGNISHSIFDAKSDAGKSYSFFSGNRRLAGIKEAVGAAMVTGPNTDSVNPVREGRLFPVRIPGRHAGIKTAIPGFYILVIEDALSAYLFMRMFGLLTATTPLPGSAGGGLDNVHVALQIQRGQRWNAGIDIYLMDAAEVIWQDLVRGNFLYRFGYNLINHQIGIKTGRVSLLPSVPDGLLVSPAAVSSASIKPPVLLPPVQKNFKANEAREWLNVGTWYFVAVAKIILYFSVPIMVAAAMLSIPVTGVMFLFGCLGVTAFGWPFWAIQMAKVGVNPQTILSFFPKHLFFGELPVSTAIKAGIDMERLGPGKFRASIKGVGNRISAADKKLAFWAGAVLPAAVGGALVAGWFMLTMAFGAVPLAIAAAPFMLGVGLRRWFSRAINRWLPNPNKQSFIKSFLHWGIKTAPLALGMIGSFMVAPSLAVFAIPWIPAAMAGGWSIFMGANIFNEFRLYHRQQKKPSKLPAPNMIESIPKHKADTWRNTLREIFGKTAPAFVENEFTSNNDPDIDPERIWSNLTAQLHQIYNPNDDPLAKLNETLQTPSFYDTVRSTVGAFSGPGSAGRIINRARIKYLAAKTQTDRTKRAATLEAEQFDRIQELNRMVIEELLPQNTPSLGSLWR
jgi:hypothetical protein